jgi:uncharacterized tellurite resistance protein B-like protein
MVYVNAFVLKEHLSLIHSQKTNPMQTDNQLLSDYSDQEKVAYLSAIASIATADRQASDDEIEFLQALCATAYLSEPQQASVLQAARDSSNSQLQSNLNVLQNSQLRFSLITDIISFAKADGQYTAEEESRIQDVARYLGIDQQQYSALSQVAEKVESAQEQGMDVTEPQFLQSSGIENTLQKAGISSGMLKGMLGLVAPLLIGRMFGGNAGVGRAGGVIGGGLLGSLLGSGMLGNVLGGGSNARRGGGGFGSIFDMLRGGRGRSSSGGLGSGGGLGTGGGFGSGGGLGSVLSSILGGRR